MVDRIVVVLIHHNTIAYLGFVHGDLFIVGRTLKILVPQLRVAAAHNQQDRNPQNVEARNLRGKPESVFHSITMFGPLKIATLTGDRESCLPVDRFPCKYQAPRTRSRPKRVISFAGVFNSAHIVPFLQPHP